MSDRRQVARCSHWSTKDVLGGGLIGKDTLRVLRPMRGETQLEQVSERETLLCDVCVLRVEVFIDTLTMKNPHDSA